MIVVCRPEESNDWYEKLWHYSVELFRNFEIPVRQWCAARATWPT